MARAFRTSPDNSAPNAVGNCWRMLYKEANASCTSRRPDAPPSASSSHSCPCTPRQRLAGKRKTHRTSHNDCIEPSRSLAGFRFALVPKVVSSRGPALYDRISVCGPHTTGVVQEQPPSASGCKERQQNHRQRHMVWSHCERPGEYSLRPSLRIRHRTNLPTYKRCGEVKKKKSPARCALH